MLATLLQTQRPQGRRALRCCLIKALVVIGPVLGDAWERHADRFLCSYHLPQACLITSWCHRPDACCSCEAVFMCS